MTGNPIADRAIIWKGARADQDGEFHKVTKPTVEKIVRICDYINILFINYDILYFYFLYNWLT